MRRGGPSRHGKIVPRVEPSRLWPGCRAPSAEDLRVLPDNLEELSATELFGLTDQLGLGMPQEQASPDMLRRRIRRASL